MSKIDNHSIYNSIDLIGEFIIDISLNNTDLSSVSIPLQLYKKEDYDQNLSKNLNFFENYRLDLSKNTLFYVPIYSKIYNNNKDYDKDNPFNSFKNTSILEASYNKLNIQEKNFSKLELISNKKDMNKLINEYKITDSKKYKLDFTQ